MAALACDTCGAPNLPDARYCSSCGAPLTVPPVEGERRLATVLFADVVGSTSIAEQLDPEDWTQIMNSAFALMGAPVTRYEGTVTRLLGDAILAIFGAPVAHEDDAERAVRAALEIQERVVDQAAAIRREFGVDLALRVGIATGTVVLSVVGDGARSEYTAIGDAVNVAARLQALARPGTVTTDDATRRLVQAVFDVEPRGPVQVKGKREPVDCFEVRGPRAVPGTGRGLEGLVSPVVGRDHEIDVLRARTADLARGTGSVVAIVGEAGLGKSRLIAELRDTTTGASWMETRAISYGQAIPYHPWRGLGRVFIGSHESDTPAEIQRRLRAFVERTGLSASDLPFLETLMAVPSDESRRALADLGGEEVSAGAARAVVSAIRAAVEAGGGTPHVLVMEDLHWADHASVELLARVAPLALTEPLLVLVALRPDRDSAGWPLLGRLAGPLGDRFSRLDLEPLGRSTAERLLGNLLATEGPDRRLSQLILDRSEGNPFYIEEVLRSLIDAGHLQRMGSAWAVVGDIDAGQIPPTLSGVLSARIDRLPEQTRRVVQTASVIGRVFQHRVLDAVSRQAPHPVAPVDPHLDTLALEQLVRERAVEPEREYIFKHALTCDAAYQLLLRARRRQLHALCGSALEELYPQRRAELAPVLAHHFAEARDDQRALTYLRLAAANARALYALAEELQHREEILRILDRTGDAGADGVDDVVAWALVRHRLNRYESVVDRLSSALAVARRLGDDRRVAEVLSWIGNVHMVTGFPSRSIPYLLESRELALRLGDDRLMLLPLWVSTWSLVDRDPAGAVTALSEVVELAHRERATDVQAHALGDMSVALARLGRFDAAHAAIRQALELAPHAGSPVKEADVHIAVGQAFREMGELDEALVHSRLGADKAYGAHGLECACAGYYGVGRAELDLEHADRALGDFRRSIEIAGRAGTAGLAPFVTLSRAGQAVARVRGGDAAAVEVLRQAIADAKASHDEFGSATISHELAEVLTALGQPDQARGPLAFAVATYRRLGALPFLAQALDLTARLHDAAGDADAAEAARADAASTRASLEAPAVVPR